MLHRGAPIIDELDLNQCPLCELQFIMTNPVSPHCTALAMRGTCTPVERASPRSTQCSEVRTNGVLCCSITGIKFLGGDISLFGRFWGILIPVWVRWWIFLKFCTVIDTHVRLLSGKFQKNSFVDSFFMDGSRVQNGRFRPKSPIFGLYWLITFESGPNIRSQT